MTSSLFSSEHRALLAAEYPRFSGDELTRRRRAIEEVMAIGDVDHLVVHGIGGRGGAVGWLTHWVVTNEAHLVVSSGERDALYVQYYNHVPLARHIAREANVSWGGSSTVIASLDELRRRGARRGRVGVMGPLPFTYARVLEQDYGPLVDLSPGYARLRLIKSEEELVWFELGARLGDLAIAALTDEVVPGLDERDLGAIVEGAYLGHGGVNGIHYFSVNAMDDPHYCVPRQHPSSRVVRVGDVITTEITANFFEYGGQVLRTFVVGAELDALYQSLLDAAATAFDAISALLIPGTTAAQLVDASRTIEENGFTTLDDLVHGYGGGYLAPVLGSSSRHLGATSDFVLSSDMMLVVQPNVVTTDYRAGVQTGECLVVAPGGPRRLHVAPRGVTRLA